MPANIMTNRTPFHLKLAHGLSLQVTRIGYDSEGIRVTVFQGMPFNFSTELQLSRFDAERLVEALQAELGSERNANLPIGV